MDLCLPGLRVVPAWAEEFCRGFCSQLWMEHIENDDFEVSPSPVSPPRAGKEPLVPRIMGFPTPPSQPQFPQPFTPRHISLNLTSEDLTSDGSSADRGLDAPLSPPSTDGAPAEVPFPPTRRGGGIRCPATPPLLHAQAHFRLPAPCKLERFFFFFFITLEPRVE